MIGVIMDKYIDLENTLIDVLGYKVLYDNIACYFGIEKMQKALERTKINTRYCVPCMIGYEQNVTLIGGKPI